MAGLLSYILDNKKQSFEEGIEIYVKWKSTHIQSAYTRYKPQLDKLRAFIPKIQNLEDLSEMHIFDYQDYLEENELSGGTIAFTIRIIRSFLKFWFEKGATSISPSMIRPRRFLTPEQPVVDQEDFEQMSELLDESYVAELQRKLAIHILWDTGMRVSEMTDLLIANIHQEGKKMRSATIKTKKTDRYNMVMWSKETERLLQQYLGWRLGKSHPTDLLFIRTDTPSEKGITTRTVERWVKKLADQAMIGKPITPHSFRHGKAHHILNNGGTAIDVQSILRHKNFNSSLNYMRLNKTQYAKRASNFLEKKKEQFKRNVPSQYKPEFAFAQNMVYNAK